MSDFVVSYERLYYAAPIVNSVRHKYGFRSERESLFTLGWAEWDGKNTFLKPDGSYVAQVNYLWRVSGFFSKRELELLKGSHRDIASKTRKYLEEELEFLSKYEGKDYSTAYGALRGQLASAYAQANNIQNQIDRLQPHPYRDKLESINRKRKSRSNA